MRIGFLKIRGFLSVYWDTENHASLSLSYKYFCSSLLFLKKQKNLEDLIRGWVEFVYLGCLFSSLFYRPGSGGKWKEAWEKTKTVTGHGRPFPHLCESIKLGFPTWRWGCMCCFHRTRTCSNYAAHACTCTFFHRSHPFPWRAQLKSAFRSGRQVCCASGLWGTATHALGMKHSPQQIPVQWKGSWCRHHVCGGFS